jgi:hypothetical protein
MQALVNISVPQLANASPGFPICSNGNRGRHFSMLCASRTAFAVGLDIFFWHFELSMCLLPFPSNSLRAMCSGRKSPCEFRSSARHPFRWHLNPDSPGLALQTRNS